MTLPASYVPSAQHLGPGRPALLGRPDSECLDAQCHRGTGLDRGHSSAAPEWPGGAPVPAEEAHLCWGHECPTGFSQPHPGQCAPTRGQHGVHGEFPRPPLCPANTSQLSVFWKCWTICQPGPTNQYLGVWVLLKGQELVYSFYG